MWSQGFSSIGEKGPPKILEFMWPSRFPRASARALPSCAAQRHANLGAAPAKAPGPQPLVEAQRSSVPQNLNEYTLHDTLDIYVYIYIHTYIYICIFPYGNCTVHFFLGGGGLVNSATKVQRRELQLSGCRSPAAGGEGGQGVGQPSWHHSLAGGISTFTDERSPRIFGSYTQNMTIIPTTG